MTKESEFRVFVSARIDGWFKSSSRLFAVYTSKENVADYLTEQMIEQGWTPAAIKAVISGFFREFDMDDIVVDHESGSDVYEVQKCPE